MDTNFILEFLKMLLLLPLILLLAYCSLKYGGKYMSNLSSGKIIKVHERVPLGQNSFLSVVTIGGKPYVITNGEKGAQILLELDENIIQSYQMNQDVDNKFTNINIKNYIESIRGKVKK
jgi:flagellar protein FliO/FliZ